MKKLFALGAVALAGIALTAVVGVRQSRIFLPSLAGGAPTHSYSVTFTATDIDLEETTAGSTSGYIVLSHKVNTTDDKLKVSFSYWTDWHSEFNQHGNILSYEAEDIDKVGFSLDFTLFGGISDFSRVELHGSFIDILDEEHEVLTYKEGDTGVTVDPDENENWLIHIVDDCYPEIQLTSISVFYEC